MDVVEMARRYAGYKEAIEKAEAAMKERGSKTGPPPASAEFARLVAERTKLAHAIAEEASRGLAPIPPDPAPRFRWEPPKVAEKAG